MQKIATALNKIVFVLHSFSIPLAMGVAALMEIPPMSLMIFVELDVQSFLK